jgi:outer membrane protein assembly factor BamB
MKTTALPLLLLFNCTFASAADWPCFRGPNRSGISEDKGLPLEWSDTKNIIWKTALPGPGASSPITFGSHIYITCYSGYGTNRELPGQYENLTRHLLCIDPKDGRILWNAARPNKMPDDHWGDFINRHGYASSTPVADASGVYVYYGTTGVGAYSHDGMLRWERSCGKKYQNFGTASSPVLFGNFVIVNADIEGGGLVALDKNTGVEVWRVPTTSYARGTPLLVPFNSSQELVFHLKGSHNNNSKEGRLAAVDPRNGNKLWECQALDSYLHPSPITADGVVYAIGSYPGWTVAIRAGGRGDVTATHKRWEIKKGSTVCTPVFYEGHLYWTYEDRGIAVCVNAKTGAIVYEERLLPTPKLIYASGVIADGKLYYVSRDKGTYVLAAKSKFELLAHNAIASDTSIFNATPAVHNSRLLLRSDKFLYCVGVKN